MKRFLYLISLLFLCVSCENQLLPIPNVQNGQNQSQTGNEATAWAAPQELSATHGQKQEITLSWHAVKKAVRYYVYRAATPYDTFKQIGETSDAKTTYTLKVPAGTDAYYKVTAVDAAGKESPFSLAVRGTSLAQPVISDIQGSSGAEDSAITVYWYMGNVDAYQSRVRYTVICSDARNTEIARIPVDGSITATTQASFTGLTPNTSYAYRVEAYLVTAQDKIETSEAVDAATARRLRPNPPESLSAAEGTAKDNVKLTFTLPDFVDVAVSSGVYEQHALYFKIYRRVKAADGQQPAAYTPICAYFGKDADATGKVNFGSSTYEPGATVTYTDTAELTRGVRYEYKVQAFADDTTREITSDLSSAETSGWMLAAASFKTDSFRQTVGTNSEGNPAYVAAEVGFKFSWDALGKDSDYQFIIEEIKYKLEGDNGGAADTEGTVQPAAVHKSVADVNEYRRSFDLAGNGAAAVRGYYKYKLYIVPAGVTDTAQAVDSVAAVGQILVTDDTAKPKINVFSVTSGYKDKFEISWEYDASLKYELRYRNENAPEAAETVITEDELASAIPETVKTGDTVTYTDPAASGDKRTYTLYAKSSVTENTDPVTAETLQTPAPLPAGYAYDSVTVKWPKIAAEKFSLSCAYADNPYNKDLNALKAELEAANLNADDGYYSYTFSKPDGYDDARVSGRPITVSVSAVSSVVKKTITLQPDETYTESQTVVTSDTTTAQLSSATMGPALVSPKATQSVGTDAITVTWKKVSGAAAYAVVRTYYETPENGIAGTPKSVQTYTVTGTDSTPTVSLSGGLDENITAAVTVKQNADGSYTLNDTAIQTVTDQNSGWQTAQSRLPWGSPYDYAIIPLVSADDMSSLEYDSAAPERIVVGGVTLTHASDPSVRVRGSTLGYGWNVQASKGWQTAALSGEATSAENTSVLVTWTNPTLSAGISPIYRIYRRIEKTDTWETISDNCKVMSYEDTTAVPGIVYEYAVGLITAVSSKPIEDTAYIAFSDKITDTTYTAEKRAAGFILPIPKIGSASRTDLGAGNERIEWTAAENGGVYNRMLSGYVIEVLNHNLSSDWQKIKELKFDESGFTAQNTYSVTVDNTGGLLKVLRDYKHYFRIRTFTQNADGKRTYSPQPTYTWADGAENEYVKWGARQITAEEFTKATLIGMSTGMYKERGTSGSISNGKGITGLSSKSKYNIATDYTITLTYTNYDAKHLPKSGTAEVAAVNISGTLKARGGLAGAYQTHYWTDSPMTVIYNGMSGTIQFNGENSKDSSNVSRSSGTVTVVWNNETVTYDMGNAPGFTLPFAVSGGYLNDTEEWK